MVKMKKKIALVLAGLILIGGGYYFIVHKEKLLSQGEEGQLQQSAVLFVGATCPHCRKVEEWLKENKIVKEKAGIIIKEVYYHQDNARELKLKAEECRLENGQGIGVPFLYHQGKCIIGDQPIIDYLREKYKQ